MPNMGDLERVPNRDLHVFYVLDTSGSMAIGPIGVLNRAMEETIYILRDEARKNADANLKIAVLEFNTNPRWMSERPEDIEDFLYEDLTAGGLTQMGAALAELNSKLSRKAFLNSMTGAYVPIIIFMTDGAATDDYTSELNKIRQNKWFRRATKIGFAVGNNPDYKMIAEVVGNSEAVINTEDWGLFAKLIRFASVTASMLASQSQTSNTAPTGASIVRDIIQQNDMPDDIIVRREDVGDIDTGWDDDDDDDFFGKWEATSDGSESGWDDDEW